MGRGLRQHIRTHRREPAVRGLAQVAEKYLRAYYNEGFYEFDRNGERFVLDRFARWRGCQPTLVWDVGANKGQWARTVRGALADARVFSFEIVPHLAEIIEREASAVDWWTIERCGLSDREGEIEVCVNLDHDTATSITPAIDNRWYQDAQLRRVRCAITTLDQVWRRRGDAPHFLKIDVEGHEGAVLDGGAALLADATAPPLVQFEYGSTWIPAGRMLGPVQRRLEAVGYSVGRAYPNHVDFRPYATGHDNFRMGNMIAVRDSALRALLAG